MLSWSVTVILAPLVEAIASDFGLASEADIGNISASFLLVGGILSFVWVAVEDALSKRYDSSRKYLLILTTIIWAIGLFLSSIAQNYGELFTYQMVTAVGFAAITPLAFSMAMDLTPPKDRAKAFGLLDIAGMLGVGVGFLLSSLMVYSLPWAVPFVVVGTFGLVLSGFVLNIQEPKRGIQERELSGVLSSGAEYKFHITRESFFQMLKRRANLLLILFTVLLYIAAGSVNYYFIRMMVIDHGFSSSMAVLFFFVTYGGQAIGALFWTKRADKLFARKPNGKVRVLLEMLVVGPGFLVAAYSLSFSPGDVGLIALFGVLLFVGMFLVGGLMATSFNILGDVNPPEMRTTIFSMNNLALTFGRGFGIFMMGGFFTLFGGIYHWGFTIASGMYFTLILFALPLTRSVPKDLQRLSSLLDARARDLEQNPPTDH